MAVQFYNTSITPDIKDWSDLEGSSTSGDYKVLAYDGECYAVISQTGLIASNYTKIEFEYEDVLTDEFNYQNKVYIVLAGHYENGSKLEEFKIVVAVNGYNSKLVEGVVAGEMKVDTQGLTFHDLVIYVVNNNSNTITVRKCLVYKSIDNNEGQAEEQITTAINSFYSGNRLLEVDTRTANKLKITYLSGTITYDWQDDTTNHVVTLTNGSEEIKLKY